MGGNELLGGGLCSPNAFLVCSFIPRSPSTVLTCVVVSCE